MGWTIFVAGAVLSWGVYGAMLHQGQQKLGSPLRALLCVGLAYFLIGVTAALAATGVVSLDRRDIILAVTYTMNYNDARGWPLGSVGPQFLI